MNYIKIEKENVSNGSGLRVVLWLSGCSHCCPCCQNPQTWDEKSGIEFDSLAEDEIIEELKKDYISGITLSGGDPLYENNLEDVLNLVNKIRILFPTKTIWLYTGYEVEIKNYQYFDQQHNILDNYILVPTESSKNPLNNFIRTAILNNVDVIVDGRYIDSLRDITLKWRGSSNQRVIDVKESIKQKQIILYDS